MKWIHLLTNNLGEFMSLPEPMNRGPHLSHGINYEENQWIHLFSYIIINEFISSTMNSFITWRFRWIHSFARNNDQMKSSDTWIHLWEKLWIHLLSNIILNEFINIFDKFIYLRQPMIRWTHLLHEFNYEENQWIHLFSHII